MQSYHISLCDLPWWAVLASWLLPALLGYFWGVIYSSKYKNKNKNAEKELSSASRRIVNLENEITESRKVYEKLSKEKDKLLAERKLSSAGSDANKSNLGAAAASTPDQSSYMQPAEIIHETKRIFGYAIKRNDLKIIDGIDSRIEKLLHEVGIHDWHKLETADINYLNALLNEAGYSHISTESWPYQSSLARQEKWEELKEYQAKLKS